MKIYGKILLIFMAILFFCGLCAADEIKGRMIGRLKEIKALKADGIIGENNRGYLEFLGAERNQALVEAENRDRKAVYEAIARRQGISLEVVEKHRAAQIEQKADKGEWLQDAEGKWYQKP